jgi:hypothetical protein
VGGTTENMTQMKSWYQILIGKPEGKRPHGRPRQIWENNIEVNLK